MKLRRSVSRRTYIVSLTLFILTALFSYYFLAFLPQKENQLIAQRVRALDRIGENFQEKFQVFNRNIFQSFKKDLYADFTEAEQNRQEILARIKLIEVDSETPFLQRNSILAQLKEELLLSDFILAEAKKKLKINRDSASRANQQIRFVEESSLDDKIIRFKKLFTTSFTSFFSPLRLSESFDGYIVYRDTVLVHQDIPGEIIRVPAQLYTELDQGEQKGRFVRHNLESRTPERYETPRVYEAGTQVQLASINYRLFCSDFTTDDGYNTTRWTIYGLVTKDTFDAEKKRIPFLSIVLLSLSLLLLLFSMPLMKLFFMSPIERLHRTDALLTPPTFIVCSAISMLIILIMGKYYLSDIPKVDDRLANLADTISHNFKDEIRSIYQLAKESERCAPSSSSSLAKSKSVVKSGFSPCDFNIYPYLRNIYWLDQNGDQRFEYSMLNLENQDYKGEAIPNYKDRAYFKMVRLGEGFTFYGDRSFYLQSLVSWTTGEPISVFSVPIDPLTKKIVAQGNQHSEVLAISTVLHSLTDPVLPPGYSFHMMDAQGQVLYHANQEKNLQENFLEEVDRKQPLIAAMASRTETTDDAQYYNHSYRTHIQPIDGIDMPWYLVTTYDKRYLEAPYQHILSFCILGIVLVSITLALQFISIALVYHRPSKLKRKLLTFQWLWPYSSQATESWEDGATDAANVSRDHQYRVIIFLNVVYAIILIVHHSFSRISLPETVTNFLIAIILSYAATFALLQRIRDNRYLKAIVISLVISVAIMLFGSWFISIEERTNYRLLFWLVPLIAVLAYVSWLAYNTLQYRLKVKNKQQYEIAIICLIVIIVVLVFLISERVILLNYNNALLKQIFIWAAFYLLALLACIAGSNRLSSTSDYAQRNTTASQQTTHPAISSSSDDQSNTAAASTKTSGPSITAFQKHVQNVGQAINRLPKPHSYCFMVFSYLLLSSFIFVFFLFGKTYDYEKRIWSKFGLYHISQELNERESQLRHLYNIDDPQYSLINDKYRRYDSAKSKGLYYRSLNVSDNQGDSKVFPTVSSDTIQTEFDELIIETRPTITELSTLTNGFVKQQGEGWSMVKSDSAKSSLGVSFNSNTYYSCSNQLILATSPLQFVDSSLRRLSIRHLFILLLILTLLGATYRLLRFGIFRLFGMQIFHFREVIQIDDDLMKNERGKNKESEKQPLDSPHRFVVSMPFAGAEELYGSQDNREEKNKNDVEKNDQHEENNKKYTRIDFSWVLEENFYLDIKEQVLHKRNENVVLEHFSYGIEDHITNQRRLALLEILLANNNRVTIISKLTPMQLTAKFEEVIENVTYSQDIEELETRVSRWKDILSSFVKLYYSDLVCERNRKRLREGASIKELIYYEMSVNKEYFKRMDGTLIKKLPTDNKSKQPEKDEQSSKESLKKIELTEFVTDCTREYENTEDIKEEVLLKIQSMAQPFYLSLWNTCSKEEKYILYDLADDGFVNTQNKPILLGLMEKGLIFYDESFHVMNESFRNFILSNIKQSEALEMEQQARKNGRWSVYSTVILLLVVSLVFFVVFAHESIVNQFVALLAGVTAAVPYLLRLVGLIGLSTGSRDNSA